MEKIILPTKTKIAAWWMIVIGGIVIVLGIKAAGGSYTSGAGLENIIFFITSVFLGSLLIITNLLLLKRKKVGWEFSIFILSILLISLLICWISLSPLFSSFFVFVEPCCLPFLIVDLGLDEMGISFPFTGFFLFLLLLIPLILLLLDRKNFWKIAN